MEEEVSESITKFLKMYELHQKKCCDPMNSHKKTIKTALSTVTLHDARFMQLQGCKITPGKKLCKTCIKKISEYKEDFEIDEASDDDFNDDIIDETIDDKLVSYGLSPLKKHAKSLRHKRSEGKGKLAEAQENLLELSHEIEDQTGASTSLLMEPSTEDNIRKKAEDFDEMIALIKNKISISDKRTAVQILTLAPQSWSIREVKTVFDVTEYQAKKARQLFHDKGLLAMPPAYQGKKLSKEVEEAVSAFYENDQFSRCMPGKKDCVSIAKHVFVQKRLILSNLKELFLAFKEANPIINNGTPLIEQLFQL